MFGILIPIILAIVVGITGFFGYEKQQDQVKFLEQQIQEQQNVSLGSFYPVGGKYYRLFVSLTSSATSIILTSFTMPVSDQEFVMGNFGEIGYGTIEPENTSNVELVSFTGITQDSGSAKATLTGVSRGLSFTYPYSASTTLAKSHSGGSRFIISNPPPLYGEYAAKKNAETISGDWTWNSTSTPQYNQAPIFTTQSQEFCTIDYAEDLANAGAANAATTTAGIVQIANSEQIKMTTTTGSSGRLLVLYLGQFATSTDKRGATTTAVLTDTDGKIDYTFIDKSDNYTWTGANTHSGINTFNASTSFYGATSTFADIPTLPARNPTGDNQAVRKAYADSGFGLGVFGDGSDGASTTAAGITLTRDHYFTDWTINSGVNVTSSGYRIFVSGTLTNNGTISNKGTHGTTTSSIGGAGAAFGSLGGGATGGLNGVPLSGGGIGGGGGGVIMIAAKTLNNSAGTITVVGGNGGNAVAFNLSGSGGLAGGATTTSLGGSGGAGGESVGGDGGAGGTATAPLARYGGFRNIPQAIILHAAIDSVWHTGLVKGGGGGGAGGADQATPFNDNGGGGGGGGGLIVLIYTSITSGTESVAGGSGGAASGTGTAGTAGSAGTKIQITI